MTAADELVLIDAAIVAALGRIASDSVVEYQLPNGQRVRRREGGASTLQSLYARRDQLQRRISHAATSPIRVAKLGRANAVS